MSDKKDWQTWLDIFVKNRDKEASALNARIEQLEAVNADLLAACQIAFGAINLNDETLTAREVLVAVIAEATQP